MGFGLQIAQGWLNHSLIEQRFAGHVYKRGRNLCCLEFEGAYSYCYDIQDKVAEVISELVEGTGRTLYYCVYDLEE